MLCEERGYWSSGVPDLFLWKDGGSQGPVCKIVEVKGGADKLSEQQRAWIDRLLSMDFEVELCLVSYQVNTPGAQDG